MFLVIRKAGVFRTAIQGGRIADLRAHLENGYPRMLPAFDSGLVTGEEVESLPAVPQAEADARLAQLAAEQQEEAAAKEQQDLLGKVLALFLDHENRLRVFEGKAPVTRAQLIARVRSL